MGGAGWKVLELGPRSFREVDGEGLDDEVVILDLCHAEFKAIVF